MSTSATVPVFDPQGLLRDVPQDMLAQAVKAGGMPSVKFQAPDGSVRFVPASRTHEAIAAGGKILPFEQQEVKHPGVWAALADDLKNLPANVWKNLTGPDPLADPRVSDEEKNRVLQQQEDAAAAKSSRRQAEHGALYDVAASAGEMAGLNVEGAEKSASEGDPGGVVGHLASTPVAAVLTEGALRAPGAVRAAVSARLAGRIADAITAPSPTSAAAPLIPEQRLPAAFQDRVPTLQGPPGSAGNPFRGPAPPEPTPPARPAPQLPEAFQPLPPRMTPPVGTADNPFVSARPAGSAGTMAESVAEPAASPGSQPAGTGKGMPRTLSGESALREILAAQENSNLIKIAKSRGLSVSQESQLKAGPANKLLINKIIDDFSDDELDNLRSTYLENERNGHDFSPIEKGLQAQGLTKQAVGDRMQEIWNTLALQTYFPDVKISTAQQLRVQDAIARSGQAPVPKTGAIGDVASALKKNAKAAAKPKPAAAAAPGAPASADEAAAQSLDIWQKSLDLIKQQKGQQ